MINLNTSKTLNIVLPNTNKALNEVVKSITPQELETLSKGRDLKSLQHPEATKIFLRY